MKQVYWRYALIGLAVIAFLLAVVFAVRSLRTRTVVLATSAEGTLGHAAGMALAEVVDREVPRLRIEVAPTEGSADALARLEAAEVDMAIVQANVPSDANVRLLAYLYPLTYHLIAADGSGIESVADLTGKRVGLPPAATGSTVAFRDLLNHYNLAEEDLAALQHRATDELGLALRSGDLEAVFVADFVGAPALATALQAPGLYLVPIDQVPAMRLRQPLLEEVVIPRGAYRAGPPMPAEDLATAAVNTALVAYETMDSDLALAMTRVLFDFQRELTSRVPALVALQSPLEAESVSFPLHAGAEDYYFRDEPGFLASQADVIGLWITLGTLALSGVLALRQFWTQRHADRVESLSRELVAIIQAAQSAQSKGELEAVEKRLVAALSAAVAELDAERIDHETFDAFMADWNNAAESVRHSRSRLDAREE